MYTCSSLENQPEYGYFKCEETNQDRRKFLAAKDYIESRFFKYNMKLLIIQEIEGKLLIIIKIFCAGCPRRDGVSRRS